MVDQMTGELRPALSNALLLSAPGSRFVEVWRAEIGDAPYRRALCHRKASSAPSARMTMAVFESS